MFFVPCTLVIPAAALLVVAALHSLVVAVQVVVAYLHGTSNAASVSSFAVTTAMVRVKATGVAAIAVYAVSVA